MYSIPLWNDGGYRVMEIFELLDGSLIDQRWWSEEANDLVLYLDHLAGSDTAIGCIVL
jgi:hypothetical protein